MLNFLSADYYSTQGKTITNFKTTLHHLRTKRDNHTIGLLICKEKNHIKAEWALESSSQPIGISEYQLANLLPKEIRSSLPSIEDIESELEKRECVV